MSNSPDSRRKLEARLQKVKDDLVRVIDNAGSQHLRECFPKWEQELDRLHAQLTDAPEVAISLLGGVGAGKTTLINALLGEKILPTSQNRACTSAVCEITGSDEPAYRATITFLSREEWAAEVQRAKADIASCLSHADNQPSEQTTTRAIRTAAEQKLRAIYQLDKDTEPQAFLREAHPEPSEVAQALDAGTVSFTGDPAKPTAFAKQVRRYLAADEPFWPIVKSVSICGPFTALRGGVRLVDLPGVDDPNEAREAVARGHLKNSQFVWVVSRIRTFLSRHMAELFQSEDFFRDLLMSGKTERLAFIGTQADGIDVDEARVELGLEDDLSTDEVVAANNRAARSALAESLTELAFNLADQYGEGRDWGTHIAERLRAAPVFTVSARDFLNLRAGKKSTLESVERTELPALQAHLATLARNYGLERHLEQITGRLRALVQDIRRELDALRIRNQQRGQMTAQQRKEVQTAATAALTFLDGKLCEYQERYAQDLVRSRELLTERFKRGTLQGRQEVDRTVTVWSKLHVNTLAATCRNAGRFASAAGKQDLPLDLTRPILNAIAFTWDEFFGEKLGRVMTDWYDKLLLLSRDHAREFVTSVYRHLRSDSKLRPDVQKLEETTAKVLAEQLAVSQEAMTGRIEQTRRTLHERIPDRVRAALRPAFEKAGQETGKGMRDRIIDSHLRPAAEVVARDVFGEAEEEITRELRGLQDALTRSYGQMADTVRRHAKTNADNFWQDAHELSLDAIEQEQKQLRAAADILATFAV